MNKKLGTGISKLIPTMEELLDIPIEDISLSPWQPRKSIQPENLNQLMESIQTSGLIQPILVRPTGDTYELVAGERRLKAAKQAGHDSIKAIIRTIPDETVMEISLMENIHREELTPIEIAQAIKKLCETKSLTQEEVAARLGMSRSQIANYLRILNLSEEIKELIHAGLISFGHAKLLTSLPEDLSLKIAHKIKEKGMSVNETQNYLNQLINLTAGRNSPGKNNHHDSLLENFFSSKLSCKVQVMIRNNGLLFRVPMKANNKLVELIKEMISKNV